jgi:heptosyltransferase-2
MKEKDPGPKKILVLQTAFIGDVMMITPLLESLRRGYPQAEIQLLASPPASEVMRGDPRINRLIPYDKRKKETGFFSFISLMFRVRRGGFDLLISPHRSARTRILAMASGIPVRIGFGTSSSPSFNRVVDPALFSTTTQQYTSLLQPLGLNGGDPTPSLPLKAEEVEKAEAIINRAVPEFSGFKIGFAPGSVWPTKRWLWESFAELAGRAIDELPAAVFLVGGADDSSLGEEIARAVGRPELVNLIGQLPLRISAAVIGQMDAMVTNDTGLLHVARSQDIPTVSIFGSTTHELFNYGPRDHPLVPEIECHPCSVHGTTSCPEDHFDCMRKISVERVYEALRLALKEPVTEK